MAQDQFRDGNDRSEDDVRAGCRAVGKQIRASETRMGGDAGQAPAICVATSIKLKRKHQHGEFGLRIDRESIVSVLVIEIVD